MLQSITQILIIFYRKNAYEIQCATGKFMTINTLLIRIICRNVANQTYK